MTKETRFRKQFDLSYGGTPSVVEFGPSVTEPDLNLTVKELMERHTRGVGVVPEPKTEYYEDDIGDEVPVITDLTDIQDLKERNQAKVKELEKQLEKERDERIAQIKQKKDAEAAKAAAQASKAPPKEE